MIPLISSSPSPFDVETLLTGQVAPSSKEKYQRLVRQYLLYAFTHGRDPLTSTTLAEFRTFLANETTFSASYIGLHLAAVKRVLGVADEQGLLPEGCYAAFARVKGVKPTALKERSVPASRTRLLPEQLRAAIDAIDTSRPIGRRNRALFLTAATSGLRIGELCCLQQQQVLPSGKAYLLHLYAERGKNAQTDHTAPISVEAVQAIDDWLTCRASLFSSDSDSDTDTSGKESSYIFTAWKHRGERCLGTGPLSPYGAWKVIRRICEDAGLPTVAPHDLRRFVLTQIIEEHGLRVAQQVANHRSPATTARYDMKTLTAGLTETLL